MVSLRTLAVRALIRDAEHDHARRMASAPPLYVIVGFPRSGTSLLGQLLAHAGVYFGERSDLMPEDTRNPRGYFEHTRILALSRRFLREAGAPNDLEADSLRSRGWGRLTRLFTRRAMMHLLQTLYDRARGAVGIKLFPLFLYAWAPYLPPSTRLIVLYRDPRAVVPSFLSAWPGGLFTIPRLLRLWTETYQDLLMRLPRFHSAVVVRYEDLLDPALQEHLLAALRDRLDLSGLSNTAIDNTLDRSSKKRSDAPLPVDTTDVLRVLDDVRLR